MKQLLFAAIAAIAGASTLLSGCVPLVVGAAVAGTAVVATDRRSVGVQADDEAVELKIASSINTGYGDRVHVNATCYNGIVLLTGEAPTADVVAAIGETARTTANGGGRQFGGCPVGRHGALVSSGSSEE